MPRPLKFQPGDVVTDIGNKPDQLAVVVDYRQDDKGRGEYRVIRLTNAVNGHLYGPAHWVKSYRLHPTGSTYKRAVSVYRNNAAIGTAADRGCRCNCCIHTAIPASVVKADGTFYDDDDEEGRDVDIQLRQTGATS